MQDIVKLLESRGWKREGNVWAFKENMHWSFEFGFKYSGLDSEFVKEKQSVLRELFADPFLKDNGFEPMNDGSYAWCDGIMTVRITKQEVFLNNFSLGELPQHEIQRLLQAVGLKQRLLSAERCGWTLFYSQTPPPGERTTVSQCGLDRDPSQYRMIKE